MTRPANRTIKYRWTLRLESSPEALWPLVADTNRFNRETGVPSLMPRLSSDDRSLRSESPLSAMLRLRVLGQTIEWLEAPFEWIEPRRFSIVRRYTRGPMRRMDVRLTLEPQGGGTLLTYEVDAAPRNVLGRLAIPIQIGLISRRAFLKAFRAFDAARLAGAREQPTPTNAQPLAAEYRGRSLPSAARFRDALLARNQPRELIDQLLLHIASADDLLLARLKPYALAEQWGADRAAVLTLMLHATRAGLLDLRWDLLCPLCRGSKADASTLSELPPGIHCDACHIDITANLERLVELTFRPNPTVRAVEPREYCIGGPRVTPHIAVQQLLAPDESRIIDLTLAPGRYRLRSKTGLDPEPDRAFQLLRSTVGRASHLVGQASRRVAAETSLPDSRPYTETKSLRLSPADFSDSELSVPSEVSLTITNTPDRTRLFMLERLDWAGDAVTAAEVFALQAFRDLFSAEALRPGEQVSVGSITLLFTDLKDSTRMYREIGDAPAFGRVMSHFDVLKDAVANHRGAIVKTMGDAIMAVFTTPSDAVAAALAMHADLRGGTATSATRSFAHVDTSTLRLKAAVHTGPCIAVTLNDRLDYFGSTVNIAARLVGLSRGGDIVLSDSVRESDGVNAQLTPDSFTIESIEETLKGFDDQRFLAWRVRV